MLQPSRTKFRKAHKGRIKGKATRGAALNFGSHGLQALEPERVTSRQIEAARVALTRHMQRKGRVWLRIFPNIPVSKKPIEGLVLLSKTNESFFLVSKTSKVARSPDELKEMPFLKYNCPSCSKICNPSPDKVYSQGQS